MLKSIRGMKANGEGDEARAVVQESQPLLTNGEATANGLRQIAANTGPQPSLGGPRPAPPSDFKSTYTPLPNIVVDAADADQSFMKRASVFSVFSMAGGDDPGPTESPEEIAERERHIEKLEFKEMEARTRLDEINDLWGTKVKALEEDIERYVAELEVCREELNLILNPPEPPPARPGPPALAFIDGGNFMGLCTTIIVVNLAMMIYELLHPSYAKKWWTIDQLFMAFYVVELGLKCIYIQKDAFIGEVSIVWWNWLDSVIVVSGVLDQWVQPALKASGVLAPEDKHKKGGMGFAQMLRMLRLARLARILKIVRVFLQSDLTWTEGVAFQSFIMGVIGINSLLMGFETDIPDFAGWYYIEQILLVIYSFELAVRLKKYGGTFFCNGDFFWNYMDFVIVVGGQVDQWMLPAIMIVQTLVTGKKAKPIDLGQGIVLLRMMRLLRILRLVKLVKNIPPLFNLIVGIITAMQGMVYVLILTVVLLYAFAILAVHLIEEGIIFGGECPDSVRGIFDTVPNSMFVLFNVMNGDQGTLGPLLEIMPVMKLVFCLFMIITSWAILSILTAVVSENMIAVTEKNKEEKEAVEQAEHERRTVVKLTEIFQSLDEDKSGGLNESEFSVLLVDQNLAEEFSEATGVGRYDIVDLFDILAHKEPGAKTEERVIKYKDFIQSLGKEKEGVTMRSIMRLEKRMRDLYESNREMRASMQWMIDKMAGKTPAMLKSSKNDKPKPPTDGWKDKPSLAGIEVPPPGPGDGAPGPEEGG